METRRGGQQRERGVGLAEQLVGVEGLLSELRDQYGPGVFQEFVRKITEAAASGRQVEGLKDLIEKRSSLDEFQRRALKFFDRRGVCKDPGDGVLVLNADELLDFNFRGTKYDDIAARCEAFATSKTEFILNAFRGRQGVLGEKKEKPREVFYLPKNKDEAFDVEKIRSADFIFGFWEIARWSIFRGGDVRRAVVPGAVEDVGLFEAGLAAAIYHPRFGAGFRDQSGQLMVRVSGNDFRPITAEWIEKHGFGIRLNKGEGNEKGQAFTSDIFRALKILTPNLLERGLLKETDFVLRKKEARRQLESLKTNSKGVFRYERIRYNLGSEFGDKDIRVEPVGDSLAAVVLLDKQGQGKIVGTMILYELGAPGLIERKTNVGKFYEASKGSTGFTRFDRSVFAARKEGEDDWTYGDRLSRFADLEISLRFNNDLAKASQLSLRSLPSEVYRLRSRNLPGILRQDYEAIKKFVLAEQEDGLEALAVIAHLPETSRRFLVIQEKAPQELGKQIMHSVLEIGRSRIAAEFIVQKLVEKGKITQAQGSGTLVALDRQIEEAVFETEKAVKQRIKGQNTLVTSLRAKGIELPALAERLMIDVVQDCAKVVSFEVLLGVLKEVSHGGDTILSPFFEQAQKLMTPELPDDAIKRLQDLYRAIRFEQYSLNDRMQKVDERVLEASAASGDKVVDLGAGTGRLAVPMMARGFEVTAVENTPRHVDLLKKTEGLRVVNRDWIQTGLSEESQDVAYCLGRSFLHEFTFERQNAFFEEVARILKPGGMLILDIPDRNRGNYARLVDKFGETMKDRGILYRKGTIYDSPDGKNYFTRYVFSLEDIADLARRHGFELVKTQREPLDTGAGDENIYITLRKVSPLAVEALAAA